MIDLRKQKTTPQPAVERPFNITDYARHLLSTEVIWKEEHVRELFAFHAGYTVDRDLPVETVMELWVENMKKLR